MLFFLIRNVAVIWNSSNTSRNTKYVHFNIDLKGKIREKHLNTRPNLSNIYSHLLLFYPFSACVLLISFKTIADTIQILAPKKTIHCIVCLTAGCLRYNHKKGTIQILTCAINGNHTHKLIRCRQNKS